ncbi:hypothetical protein GCM10011390_50070 [Aureimonas endophytica]|uniref:CHAT domain-containing protein n=1 Tax=Aureimonas endophytica TaxID=2027858 RepID=A0A917EEP7_9HYPH|nr:CHAT domain-containing tetratricopeptide repeat protein [Aureimonas endophytica]GGE24614.1 hypothetical protein GCM10011390_50070 [Aureimonas endophytica]
MTLEIAAREAGDAGDLSRALELSEQALGVFAKARARSHWVYALALTDRADFQLKARRWSEARKAMEAADPAARLADWDNGDHRAAALFRIGRLWRGLDSQEKALKAFLDAEKAMPRGVDVDQRRVLRQETGGVLMALGRYREAAAALDDAYALADKAPLAVQLSIRLDQATGALAERDLGRAALLLSEIEDNIARNPAIADMLGQRPVILRARLDAKKANYAKALSSLSLAMEDLTRRDLTETQAYGDLLFETSGMRLLRGEYAEVIEICLRLMVLYEPLLGPDHFLVGQVHMRLALAYREIGDLDRSAQNFDIALTIFQRQSGTESVAYALALPEKARLLSVTGRHDDAIALAQSAVDRLRAKPDVSSYSLGIAVIIYGNTLLDAGSINQAKATLLEGLRIMQSDPYYTPAEVIPLLNNLAEIAIRQNDLSKATEFAKQADALVTDLGSLGVHNLWRSRRILAEIAVQTGHAPEGLRIMEEEIAKQEMRLRRLGNTLSQSSEFESEGVRQDVETYLQAAQAVEAVPGGDGTLLDRMFSAAQLPTTTQTSRAINGASARLQTDDLRLSDLIGRRQALGVERKASDRLLSNMATDKAGGLAQRGLSELRAKIDEFDSKIAAIDAELIASYPNFVSLIEPKAVSLSAVQAALQDDEALLLQLTFGDSTQLFYVTRYGARRVERPLGTAALDAMVTKLRESLDFDGSIPPYEAGIASDLYAAIFAPFDEDMRRIRHLIFVPDQAMTSLPPAVLLASPFAGGRQAGKGDWAALDYFGRHLAISIMPSADSFVALRSIPTDTRYARSFVGIGNPILPPMPKSAREDASLRRDDGILDWHLTDIKLDNLFDTEIELKDFAKLLGGDDASLYVRGEASETNVKAAPLDGVGTIAFATHGLLANDIRGLDEPALVLSMPDHPDSLDDGFLTATEIASLKIRSDLVVLSACNTAGRDSRPGAPGLSGLTRAFFYAGARSLMVTHWRIMSTETVPLTTGFMAMRQAEPKERPSELLRRAMDEMITGRAGSEAGLDPVILAHPGVWGSFVIVGDR